MSASKARIRDNLHRLRERIGEACVRAGRAPQEIALVAVTKSADLEAVKAVVELGVTELGESRVQQLADRAREVSAWMQRRRDQTSAPVRWHMVGHLQRNKVKAVLDAVQVIHSVDSLRLAEEINERAQRDGRIIDVLLQVNCSKEPQKSGCAVGATVHLAELVGTLKSVRLVGLMTMAPLVKDPADARASFSLLRELFEELRHDHVGGEVFRHMSMGMSQDYTVAVEEGATMLRIGTALFE